MTYLLVIIGLNCIWFKVMRHYLQMPIKLTFEAVKNIIDQEETLLSNNYINNKQILDILCKTCKSVYQQTYDRYQRGHRHQKCSAINAFLNLQSSINKRQYRIKNKTRTCIECNNSFDAKRSEQKLCSKKCADKFHKTNENRKQQAKVNGRKGGVASAAKQVRRSKGEIMFAELCEQHFDKQNIKTNEQMFRDKNGHVCS